MQPEGLLNFSAHRVVEVLSTLLFATVLEPVCRLTVKHPQTS